MREKTIHQLFDISVSLKGIHALIEIASGLALALVSTGTIVRQIDGLTRSELLEDPHDFLALHASSSRKASRIRRITFTLITCSATGW